uniref:Uncharacterized protein n=1 Tax=Chromera velia CCMP2878 TaxID=1169474 RepID=A0A0G4HT52_9ALVE|eukprot:Cvel_8391.t1-p1 / transcript=Cvel_8391.t1 / gene=Cvel_8391 / organism=Chromera_velia_CCMP2878 / gene_product=hypothetical protein / transcript_product=hypothetical protein / location=Cvel_scaffold463:11682-19111(-) / protein_length=116 / sequence_SO=supercontig / SO=protein_coding / is_pseudo=false
MSQYARYDRRGAWGDLGWTFVLPNLGYLSAAQREVMGHACLACRRVSSVGGLTSFPFCVQPLETQTVTPIAPLEVDWDACPSTGPYVRLERSSKGSRAAESNLEPKGGSWELLQAV